MDYTPEMKRLMKSIQNGEILMARTTINTMMNKINNKVRYLEKVKEKRTGTLRAVYETDYQQALHDRAELKKYADNVRGLINKKSPDKKLGRVIVSINNMNDIVLKNNTKHSRYWRVDRAKDRVECRLNNLILENGDYNITPELLERFDIEAKKLKKLGVRSLSDYLYQFLNTAEPINSGEVQEELFEVLDEYTGLYEDIKRQQGIGIDTPELEKMLEDYSKLIEELRECIM